MLYACLLALLFVAYLTLPWAWVGLESLSILWDLKSSGRRLRNVGQALRLYVSTSDTLDQLHRPYWMRGTFGGFLTVTLWPLFFHQVAEDLHVTRRFLHAHTLPG